MNPDRAAIQASVVDLVSTALDVDLSSVQLHSSLIDDLGAESIDFIDLVFRLETAFGIKIPESDLWQGSIRTDDPAAMAKDIERLRASMPDFRWDRLPATIARDDLPHLITVRTIVDYVDRRLAGERPAGPSS